MSRRDSENADDAACTTPSSNKQVTFSQPTSVGDGQGDSRAAAKLEVSTIRVSNTLVLHAAANLRHFGRHYSCCSKSSTIWYNMVIW
jgi:hypothetical protein